MREKVISGESLSGNQWKERLEMFECSISMEAKEMFLVAGEKFIGGGNTHRCVIIDGSEFNHDPSAEEVWAEGKNRGYLVPPLDVAPLLRELLSDAELEWAGLWWLAVMHEPVVVWDEDPQLFVLHRYHSKGLASWSGSLSTLWFRDGGFVFVL